MVNEISVFEKEEFGKVQVVNRDGEIWFVAKDIAAALGYAQTNNMNKLIDDEDKYIRNIQNGGNYVNQALINESGLYTAIFGSTLPNAKAFKKWVTSEVLPSIRKTAQALERITYKGNIDGIVYSSGGIATTTSINIANVFQRSHKNILRAIETKLYSDNKRSAQFCANHIKEVTYPDTQGRFQKLYELDEEGFSFIVLGLTGEQADLFKIHYIEAFSKMKEAINNMFKARVIEAVLPQDNRMRQHLYIIKNPLNETIKIGVAQNVEKRLKQLQTGAGIELELVYQSLICSNAFSIEKDIHSAFEKYRTFGEWFKLSPEQVIAFVEQQTFVLTSEFQKYVSFFRNTDISEG